MKPAGPGLWSEEALFAFLGEGIPLDELGTATRVVSRLRDRLDPVRALRED